MVSIYFQNEVVKMIPYYIIYTNHFDRPGIKANM